ncbi:hypothetical protein PYCCODRAFT_1470030 [Trametes coccinea BRFM310]|uniref:Uncharacterized protein n=1 Tax=Trametes coccinea (strain BRFM310) TaxID=1353009 RepID=A0A1Y2IHH4_TRAC3|nr:hypothetical protein PYCCODRAFT_1470030 [Trametes coccinea BRFM310]
MSPNTADNATNAAARSTTSATAQAMTVDPPHNPQPLPFQLPQQQPPLPPQQQLPYPAVHPQQQQQPQQQPLAAYAGTAMAGAQPAPAADLRQAQRAYGAVYGATYAPVAQPYGTFAMNAPPAGFLPATPLAQSAYPAQPMPAGMPPLMPLVGGLSWAAIPGHPLLAAHLSGCNVCLEYLRHLESAAADASLRDALTQVQQDLQQRFWRHFQEHSRSEEGGEHAQHVRQLERELDDETEEVARYRNKRNDTRSRVEELERERNALRAEVEELRSTPPPVSRHSTGSSRFRPYDQPRDVREESPRRESRSYNALLHYNGNLAASTQRAFPTEGPMRPWGAPQQPNRFVLEAGPLCMHGQGAIPSAGPSQPRDHPMVSLSDEEEEYPIVDHEEVHRRARRAMDRAAMKGKAPTSVPGLGPTFTGRPISAPPGWPADLLAVPRPSDPCIAGEWYNFIPMNSEDVLTLMTAADMDMGQAQTRIQHLLLQINSNPALLGVSGLREL